MMTSNRKLQTILWGWLLILSLPALALEPYDLRSDGLVDPLGVDTPRLSWKLRSDERGARQTAWQLLVASSREKLHEGAADRWDSGRVEGNDQLFIRYRGRKLESAETVFWKLRVWDADGQAGPWSEVARWTTGLLHQDAWQAEWIAHPEWLAYERPRLGYRSESAESTDTPKWIRLDLGDAHRIDEVRLHALRHSVAERLGFPTRYRIEAGMNAELEDAVTLADTTADPLNPWLTEHRIPAHGLRARYLRLHAPELRDVDGEIALAFNQIEVISGGRNVALGATVTASDSREDGVWAAQAVVDGLGLPESNPVATETVRLRRDFAVDAGLEQALVFVSGQGQYVMQVNGERVGDAKLAPGWTDAAKTVLYDTHDVTALLRSGGNALGVTLSGGMYNVPDPGGRYSKFVGRFQPLKAIVHLRLEYADGRVETVTTDGRWQAAPGPVVYSHVYGGEVYDARREEAGWSEAGFESAQWVPAAVTESPGGWLRGSSYAAPPVKVIETLQPVVEESFGPRTRVIDLGQNAPLMLRLRVRGAAGARVRVMPAELLKEDGRIDSGSARHGQLASWDYILRGGGVEEWEAEHFYHGGRYLQLELTPSEEGGSLPEIESIEGLVVHSSSNPRGHFVSSSELFNATRRIIRWAQRSNMVSVFTDCPHRERLGWLEQYHLNGPSLRYEFELGPLFHKTFGDMADSQTASGLIPNIAPEYIVFSEAFRDSPEWGSALILAAWQQYVFTGDDRVFRERYNEMQQYFEYLARSAEGHILDHGLGDWYDLGPERPGYSQLTPRALTATATYYANARVLGRIARLRGRIGEAVAYEERAAAIRDAFNERFFDPESGIYATGSQSANAIPYARGMVPEGREEDVLDAIVRSLEENDYANTAGDVGHRYLLRALAKGGRSDLIFRMHHQSDRPGYGWQLERGATTLTESWDGDRRSSQNHFMLGHIIEWFYRDLAGIASDPEQPGFGHVVFRPQVIEGIDWAEARVDSPRGPVSIRWERDGDAFSARVTVPPNATATLHLPAGEPASVRESGRRIAASGDIERVGANEAFVVFDLAAGSYYFESRL